MCNPYAAGMRELTLRIRVAAYVLRRRAGRSVELLVFDHDADLPPGTHVPAGGVAPEEPLEEAVLREVAEEVRRSSSRRCNGLCAVWCSTPPGVRAAHAWPRLRPPG
ncbi:NUDIX domain-containing protein [Streptomyces sp. Ag109_O5-1]|uniref:NUDIX domain-containing protein n=1 Tax=Streptomyces sp. Ag109_O5-1 TaxID=1938851 RepID=UPI0037DA1AC2